MYFCLISLCCDGQKLHYTLREMAKSRRTSSVISCCMGYWPEGEFKRNSMELTTDNSVWTWCEACRSGENWLLILSFNLLRRTLIWPSMTRVSLVHFISAQCATFCASRRSVSVRFCTTSRAKRPRRSHVNLRLVSVVTSNDNCWISDLLSVRWQGFV